MHIAYYDEAGDDGQNTSSSPLFVLSCCYLHYMHWRDAFSQLKELRRSLKRDFGIPVKTEMHASKFILGKNPYRPLNLSAAKRIEAFEQILDVVAGLPLSIVNVVINKRAIKKPGYGVLDKALTYSIQRLENDLDPRRIPANQFMMITDEGRVGAMRRTTRRVQQINYIPSQFGPEPYRSDIKSMIEDPLPKDSRESYFIQIADVVTFVVYNHMIKKLGAANYHGRMPAEVTPQLVESWLQRLEPSLNTKASADRFGIVCYPK